jgi:predicted  nucleic acid-binding Zn-ribbon protein
VRPAASHTLVATLEGYRLEHRVSRIAIAIAALRQRTRDDRREQGAPATHIQRVIAFEAEIEAMNARLRDLG